MRSNSSRQWRLMCRACLASHFRSHSRKKIWIAILQSLFFICEKLLHFSFSSDVLFLSTAAVAAKNSRFSIHSKWNWKQHKTWFLLKRHEASEDCTKIISPARAVLSNKTQSTQKALIIIVMIPIRFDFGLVDDVSLQLFLNVPTYADVWLSILMSCYNSKARKNSNNEKSTRFWVCHWP